MSVHISHANGISKVNYSSSNNSYFLQYPCESTSECSEYTVSFNPGIYLLEVWGSQGGDSIGYTGKGGEGGYSIGVFKTNRRKNLYLHIGAYSSNNKGYNGGANSYNTHDGRGGGATDFRLVSGKWDENFDSRIIVAGGGGGGYMGQNGGRGGGTDGESFQVGENRPCYGSQNGCLEGINVGHNGEFGNGGGSARGLGGGGYWGGGGGYWGGGDANDCGGGGGSGYVGGVSSLTNFKKLTSFSNHRGFGEARITILMNFDKCTIKKNCRRFSFSLIVCLVYK